MGCNTSTSSSIPTEIRRPIIEKKSTCLVYAMPDSGQKKFILSINKCFEVLSGKNHIPFEFAEVSTNREDRWMWIDEINNHKKVIMAFFFVNITSESQILVSVKTLNWLKAQIDGKIPLYPVAYYRNQEELANFTKMKDLLGQNAEISTFSDENPSDIRVYSEHITSCLVRPMVPNPRIQFTS